MTGNSLLVASNRGAGLNKPIDLARAEARFT
jgi:hypothetical protein